ncbi:CLUMA_CG008470, isoform A [Clunio marinus]|uniref:CLUMA_CG008470, isoform A n=1 Tax=Clunio marinus TaxID=568069 RepID=A0A1J1I7P5_9DIPT|nr:CLUMA_CG008470, isoform A [Clunio marinus]
MSDPGILCIQHCNARIFSFTLPEKCPLCHNKILNERNNFGLMPFRLPYPFVRATQAQAAVILRPTNGDFLNDYNNNTDLHIAVTTSQGVIVEFDRHGLRQHESHDENSSWEQSLVVTNVSEAWWDYWDEILSKICKLTKWSAASYKKDSHNCYSFVLTFLQSINHGELSRVACNRTLFCERFICPRTVVAGKYISLYRKIRDQGHSIHPLQNEKTTLNKKADSSTMANSTTLLKQ